MTRTKQWAWRASGAALLLMTAQAQAQPSRAPATVKCEADQNKTEGKWVASRQKVVAKEIVVASRSPTPVPPEDFEAELREQLKAVDTQFGDKLKAIEGRSDGMCPPSGNPQVRRTLVADLVENFTDVARRVANPAFFAGGVPSALARTGQTQCEQEVGDGFLGACSAGNGQDGAVLAGMPRSYERIGDGTPDGDEPITDYVTRLMWENLTDDGSIHDWDNTYDWYGAFQKIQTLNDTAFAGHTDWRLPNRFELESLVDLGRFSPAIDPMFHSICDPSCTWCSCTQPGPYWSSTSRQQVPADAWVVDFSEGLIEFRNKFESAVHVRAVRPIS